LKRPPEGSSGYRQGSGFGGGSGHIFMRLVHRLEREVAEERLAVGGARVDVLNQSVSVEFAGIEVVLNL